MLCALCPIKIVGLLWVSEWILLYVAFCIIMAISRQKEARSRDYALLLSNDIKGSLQCTLPYKALRNLCLWTVWSTVFLYRHNLDYKDPTRPEFELSISVSLSHNRIEWGIGAGLLWTHSVNDVVATLNDSTSQRRRVSSGNTPIWVTHVTRHTLLVLFGQS